MDIEKLYARAAIIQNIRAFFISRGYLELDTPALSFTLIPETSLEAFKTELIAPVGAGGIRTLPLYLTPSPEIYMKKIIARHRVNVFQISKCYRNYESLGAVHNPEFTMLEYYTMNASYRDSAALTEELFAHLSSAADMPPSLRPPFLRMTMDGAFESFAGFRLSDTRNGVPKLCGAAQLAEHARRLGITESPANPFDVWAWDDLYELILAHAVEPKLPRGTPVLLTDYPARVPCLAKDICAEADEPLWKERWELYADGIELANCYSEETCPLKVKEYFEREGRIKNKTALVPHAYDADYWKIFESLDESSPLGHMDFSGAALGIDRLIALMTGSRAIEAVTPFAFGGQD